MTSPAAAEAINEYIKFLLNAKESTPDQNLQQDSPLCKIPSTRVNVRRELHNLRLQNVYTDVKLVCQNRELRAHKFVLASGSQYFYNVFSKKGASPDFIELKEIDPDILDELISYLYTGDLNLSNFVAEKIRDLISTAKKLEINSVDQIVLDFLMKNLTLQNYILALNLCQDLNDCQCENRILKFVSENIDDIWMTYDFSCLTENQLGVIFSNMSNKKSHDKILRALLTWANFDTEARNSALVHLLIYVDFDKVSSNLANFLFSCNVLNLNKKILILKAEFNKKNAHPKSKLGLPLNVQPKVLVEKNEESVIKEDINLIVIAKDSANRLLCMKFNPFQKCWSESQDTGMSLEERPGIGYHNNKIYLMGGENYKGMKQCTAAYFDMVTEKVVKLPSFNIPRAGPAVVVRGNLLFVLGGNGRFGSYGLTVVEYLNLTYPHKWTIGRSMRKRRTEGIRGVNYKEKIFAISGGPCQSEFFNTAENYWTLSAPLPLEAQADSAFHVVANDQLYAFREYKPDCLYRFNCQDGGWICSQLRGKSPEWVVSAVGWKTAIFVLEKSKVLFVLDMETFCWSLYSKLPNRFQPVFIGLDCEGEVNSVKKKTVDKLVS